MVEIFPFHNPMLMSLWNFIDFVVDTLFHGTQFILKLIPLFSNIPALNECLLALYFG